MNDTNIVVVGNVLTSPEWRRTASTNTLVANFRVASTSRRMDRESGRWVDGNQFRVRVNCWRRLAEGVAASVRVGDPVVVAGRLFTRDWTDSEGNPRLTYELEAVSVGHDLSRGRGRFFRNKPAGSTSTEGAETDEQVRGEAVLPVSEDEAPTVYGDGVLDGDEPTFEETPPTPGDVNPAAVARGGGIEPLDTTMVVPDSPEEDDAAGAEQDPDTDANAAAEPETPARRPARSRSSRRQPVPA